MPKSRGRITIRVSEREREQIENGTARLGCPSTSAFIRIAIRNAVADPTSAAAEAEKRLAASLEGLSRDIARVTRGQQALFAYVDTFVKAFLTCVPEPSRDTVPASILRARDRYTSFLRSAGQAMVGESLSTLRDLANHAD